MIWHVQLHQHWNQFGFAATTAFLDPQPVPDVGLLFTCNDCGAEVAQVVVEITVLFWTFGLVAHREVEE